MALQTHHHNPSMNEMNAWLFKLHTYQLYQIGLIWEIIWKMFIVLLSIKKLLCTANGYICFKLNNGRNISDVFVCACVLTFFKPTRIYNYLFFMFFVRSTSLIICLIRVNSHVSFWWRKRNTTIIFRLHPTLQICIICYVIIECWFD